MVGIPGRKSLYDQTTEVKKGPLKGVCIGGVDKNKEGQRIDILDIPNDDDSGVADMFRLDTMYSVYAKS